MNQDIIPKLDGLIQQATVERSHYYVKTVCEEAKKEIMDLRRLLRGYGNSVTWK